MTTEVYKCYRFKIPKKVYKEKTTEVLMDNFIKKIFEKKDDNLVHLQFQKFSRGEFQNRALIDAKIQGTKTLAMNTSAEFANELVRILSEKLGDKKTDVSGMIVTTENLDFNYDEKKQAMGIKKYILKRQMSGKEILKLLDEFPKAFFALSLKVDSSSLIIKEKAPKSGKPSSKGEAKPKADFCKLKTEDLDFVKNFMFDCPNFKKISVNHTFVIEKIIMPEGEKDFAKIREMAKRAGKIIREIEVDGNTKKSEIEFSS